MNVIKPKKTRTVWSGAQYFETLTVAAKKRYSDKISLHCDGLNPYEIADKEFVAVHDKDSLGDGAEIVPPLSFPDLYLYLINHVSAYTNEELKNYKSLEAYDQFICGFVRDVKVKKMEKSSNVIIKCLVMHSQRLNEKALHVWVIVSADGTILCGHCDCMAGLDECCTHIAALLFYIESGVRHRESVTVTGVRAYWTVPVTKKVTYAPVHELNLSSAKARKKEFDYMVDGNPPAPAKSNIKKQNEVPLPTNEEWFNFTQSLFEINPNAGLFTVLPGFQDQFKTKPVNYPPVLTDLFNKKNVTLPLNELLDYCDKIELAFTVEEARKLELDTKMQSKNKLWHKFRAGRITASNLRRACHSKPEKPSVSLITQICYPATHIFETPATKWGIKNEITMSKIYLDESKKKHQKSKFERAGLFLNSSVPFLGASPDGLVECDCCGKGVVEIKCPYTLKEKPSTTIDSNSCLEKMVNGVRLRRDHAYYYQVQAQIFLTERLYCDFCIWTPVDHFIERIYPDKTFWEEQCVKAKTFFQKAILPELCGKYFSNTSSSLNKLNSKRPPTSPLKRIPQVTFNGRQRPISPTKGQQPPLSPIKGQQRPISPTKGQQPPLSPIKGQQPPLSPIKGQQPPLSPIKGQQPPLSPIKGQQPPLSPIKGLQPPRSPLKQIQHLTFNRRQRPFSPTKGHQPPSSPIKGLQPPSSPIKGLQPPSSPIKSLQPPSSPIKGLQPPSSPIKGLQPPSSPIKLRYQLHKSPAKKLQPQNLNLAVTELAKSPTKMQRFSQPQTSLKRPPRKASKKETRRMPLMDLSPNKKQKKPNPKLWCYCKKEEGSELMIGCDRDDCAIQWFHAACLKIDIIKSGKWFCPECSKRNKLERRDNRNLKKNK